MSRHQRSSRSSIMLIARKISIFRSPLRIRFVIFILLNEYNLAHIYMSPPPPPLSVSLNIPESKHRFDRFLFILLVYAYGCFRLANFCRIL